MPVQPMLDLLAAVDKKLISLKSPSMRMPDAKRIFVQDEAFVNAAPRCVGRFATAIIASSLVGGIGFSSE